MLNILERETLSGLLNNPKCLLSEKLAIEGMDLVKQVILTDEERKESDFKETMVNGRKFLQFNQEKAQSIFKEIDISTELREALIGVIDSIYDGKYPIIEANGIIPLLSHLRINS